ncbi:helix-turn-helix domain-containing protein [Gorillibacterium sp. sgz5001074]|uniref:helix-turn-helix domain-containing protein n=1 Tax=Gorillibacterium sp. sgz5001074 TaxID=3446695 RepID=UPI003F673138
MSIQQLPKALRYGGPQGPLRIEFDRRTGHYSMDTNHYHPAYEIYYLFSGERNYFIKDSAYPVHPGDLVIIDSAAVHKTSDMGVPNHERIVFYFEPSYFEAYAPEERELLLSPFSKGIPVLRLNLQERLQVEELLRSLLVELQEQPPGYSLHVRHMTGELLLFTARQARREEEAPLYEPSPVQKKMTDIVRHINAHYAEPLDLDSLSKQFYISKSHLSRVFKEITGFSFTEYVTTTRVKEAERLLRETETSITRISELTGFENFSHFGKIFKKLTGRSPRSYRNLYRS